MSDGGGSMPVKKAAAKKAAAPTATFPPSFVARYAGRQTSERITTPDEAQAVADKAKRGCIIIVPGAIDTLRGVAWQRLEDDGLVARK